MKQYLLTLLLFGATSCRTPVPIISFESSCRCETAFEQSRTAQSSTSFLSSLRETLNADSVRIFFAMPEDEVPLGIPAAVGPYGTTAASITLYGAHFESERSSSHKAEDILSDSISSHSAATAECSEHVSPPSSVTQNTPKGSVLRRSSNPRSGGAFRTFVLTLLKKFVFLPLLILLLAALIRYAIKAAIRRFFS